MESEQFQREMEEMKAEKARLIAESEAAKVKHE